MRHMHARHTSIRSSMEAHACRMACPGWLGCTTTVVMLLLSGHPKDWLRRPLFEVRPSAGRQRHMHVAPPCSLPSAAASLQRAHAAGLLGSSGDLVGLKRLSKNLTHGAWWMHIILAAVLCSVLLATPLKHFS
eukprot:350073-Chlamydomonas_euryale.AAC.3